MDLNATLNWVGDKIYDANRLLSNIGLATDIPIAEGETGEGPELIEEVLKTSFGSEKANKLKKLLAAASIADKALKGEPIVPVTLAATTDRAVSQAQASYKVESGEISAEKALDVLIDRSATYAVHAAKKAIDGLTKDAHEVADVVVDKGIDYVVNTVEVTVATVFPPARFVIPYVKAVVDNAKPIVRDVIHKGINKVSKVAKTSVNKIISSAKTIEHKVVSKLKKIFY